MANIQIVKMSTNQTDKTIQFIKHVFFNSLTYSDGIYRTQKIHPLFADKTLVLKEKRLIEIDKTLLFSADLPDGIREQTSIELLGGLLNVFIA